VLDFPVKGRSDSGEVQKPPLYLYISSSLFSTMTTETKMIMNKLNEIKSELDYIKSHIVDVDSVLTEDYMTALNEAEKDLQKGRTVKL